MAAENKRQGTSTRKSRETDVELQIGLDGGKPSDISTSIGFLDHMLELFAFHSGFSLQIKASGDIHVDDHHLAEDIGICLGTAMAQALGERRGIERYASVLMPMDEALVEVTADMGGRSFLYYDVNYGRDMLGSLATENIREFMAAFCRQAGITLHIEKKHGENAHHIAEAVFKGLARCMKQAMTVNAHNVQTIPSSKGMIDVG